MYRTELDAYCKRHNLEVIETYTTWGESGHHERALVKTSTGEQYRLYYDRSRRRQTLEQAMREQRIYVEGGIPNLPKQRGWRNVTLDNRKRTVRMQKRAEEDRRVRQMESEPGCNGRCYPAFCLYEATCPIHGVAVMSEALESTCD